MERTLLLSSAYEPVATISWQRAIVLLILGKVEVIEAYDRDVRSTSVVLRLPCVVRLLKRFRLHRRPVRFTKHNVFARDRWTCQYCGAQRPVSQLTQDHIVPRSLGGRSCWENVTTCCVDCNALKANRTPEQAGIRLRGRPRRPDWLPMFILRLGETTPDAWKSYCYLLR